MEGKTVKWRYGNVAELQRTRGTEEDARDRNLYRVPTPNCKEMAKKEGLAADNILYIL